MRVIRFTDEYGLAAPLYGVSEDALRERDRGHVDESSRWLALEDDAAIGAASSCPSTGVRPSPRNCFDRH